jgi:uncharacterized protein YqhQ
MTTRNPADNQVEVAIAALKKALENDGIILVNVEATDHEL